jgi:hypothetical protein
MRNAFTKMAHRHLPTSRQRLQPRITELTYGREFQEINVGQHCMNTWASHLRLETRQRLKTLDM